MIEALTRKMRFFPRTMIAQYLCSWDAWTEFSITLFLVCDSSGFINHNLTLGMRSYHTLAQAPPPLNKRRFSDKLESAMYCPLFQIFFLGVWNAEPDQCRPTRRAKPRSRINNWLMAVFTFTNQLLAAHSAVRLIFGVICEVAASWAQSVAFSHYRMRRMFLFFLIHELPLERCGKGRQCSFGRGSLLPTSCQSELLQMAKYKHLRVGIETQCFMARNS